VFFLETLSSVLYPKKDMDVPNLATEIVKKLVRVGYIAYFAGGWVRDYVMGHPSEDIDIATNAPPDKILDLFPRTILVGLAFGVVIVVIDGHQFEVATFRRDVNYQNGRKPQKIELATPEEDAYRRDFTINGMFYDPLENVVHDYVHGMEDLKREIIRTIGDPNKRFVEDRLRMIRAVRFASRFGFSIETVTQEAIRENAETLFPAVAMERVWQEFNKMSKYPRFDVALVEMHSLELLPVIFPTLKGVHLKDIKRRVAPFAHYPKECPTILYLLELFPDISLEAALDLCLYLRTSTTDAKLVEVFLKGKQLIQKEQEGGIVESIDWAYFYANPYSQLCLDVIAARFPNEQRESFIQQHQQQRQHLSLHVERIAKKKPLVSAAMLQENGIPTGKIMGELLKEAERLSILYDLKEPEKALSLLKKTHLWPKYGSVP
jgi:poly(A) polymerase